MVSMKKLMSNSDFLNKYKSHKEWQKSMAVHGEKLILENVHLKEFVFSSEFDLSEAAFIECSFQSCQFLGTDLFSVNFGFSIFEGCQFKDNNINKSQVDSAFFDKCSFNSVQIIRSDLSDSCFENCDFENCNFSSAYMVSSKFKNCFIEKNCVFEKADLRRAQFINCKGQSLGLSQP